MKAFWNRIHNIYNKKSTQSLYKSVKSSKHGHVLKQSSHKYNNEAKKVRPPGQECELFPWFYKVTEHFWNKTFCFHLLGLEINYPFLVLTV